VTKWVTVAKLTRLTHKIAIKLHIVAESCTICSSSSRRPVRILLDTPSCHDSLKSVSTLTRYMKVRFYTVHCLRYNWSTQRFWRSSDSRPQVTGCQHTDTFLLLFTSKYYYFTLGVSVDGSDPVFRCHYSHRFVITTYFTHWTMPNIKVKLFLCHEDVLGECRYSSTHSWLRH
jgi:hypothetical protein